METIAKKTQPFITLAKPDFHQSNAVVNIGIDELKKIINESVQNAIAVQNQELEQRIDQRLNEITQRFDQKHDDMIKRLKKATKINQEITEQLKDFIKESQKKKQTSSMQPKDFKDNMLLLTTLTSCFLGIGKLILDFQKTNKK